MREILFKGKRVDDGKWVQGLPIKNKVGTFISDEQNPHYCNQYGYITLDAVYPVIPETIGQFTGLVDKNGARIFEGDVVKSGIGLIGEIQFMPEHCAYMVKFRSDGNLGYEYLNDELTDKYIEVIGNIHDIEVE